jgi:hypothetical protein
VGPLAFGLLVVETSFATAWLASGVVAVFAATAILAGRGMLLRNRAASPEPRK